jgi:SNF2 family DNA or RNA helicase
VFSAVCGNFSLIDLGIFYQFSPYFQDLKARFDMPKDARIFCAYCTEEVDCKDGRLFSSCDHAFHLNCYKNRALNGFKSTVCPTCMVKIEYPLKRMKKRKFIFLDKKVVQKPAKKPAIGTWMSKLIASASAGFENCESIYPTSKTRWFKAQIMNWLAQDPKAQIIVYSQHVDFLKILHHVCEEEGWTAGQFHGHVDMEEQPEVISKFRDGKFQILLATTKKGGIGLNLTNATKTLNMEPWWNKAAETQAGYRVYRIGQTKPVHNVRFICRGFIEEKMKEMQDRKADQIKGCMENLTLEELYSFFGELERDMHGNVIGFKPKQPTPDPSSTTTRLQ